MTEYEKTNLNRLKRGQNRAVYDTETIDKILEDNFLCYVGYVYDGYSITIPMAYGKKGSTLYLHGSNGNRMLKSVLEQTKTSVTVMNLDGLVLARSGFHHSVNYRSVTLFGTLKKVEDDTKKATILENVVNKMVPNRWETLRKINQKELDQTMVVEFTINTASAKVRAEGVNDELEDHSLPIWAGVIPIRQVALPPIADDDLPEGTETPQHILDYYNQHK